jgi:LysM repeat protein
MGNTYRDYFTQVLHGISAPVSDGNLHALYAVSALEGIQGTPGNGPERYNPLNSVVPHGDSTRYNSVGVQDYRSFDNGVAGTVELLRGSPWVQVVAALRGDDGTEGVLSAFANVYKGWRHGTTANDFPHDDGLGDRVMGSDAPSEPSDPAPSHGDGPTPGKSYMVREGDTLWSIAEAAYGTGTAYPSIATRNGIKPPYLIHAGDSIAIPVDGKPVSPPPRKPGIITRVYRVVNGDTLWDIAQHYYGDGSKWTKISAANNIQNPNLIHPGDVLRIPH